MARPGPVLTLLVVGVAVVAFMNVGGFGGRMTARMARMPSRDANRVYEVNPYAGFRGGGVSGTVQEDYLPPMVGGYRYG